MGCGLYPSAVGGHDGVQLPCFVPQGVDHVHVPALWRPHKVPQPGQHTVILGGGDKGKGLRGGI